MNPRIKKLLKLSSIPGFRLSEAEQAELDAWKDLQQGITPKRKTRSKASKTASNASKEPEVVNIPSEPEKGEIEKVQNVIKPEDLTLNSES